MWKIELKGKVPSKKNQLRPRKTKYGKITYYKDTDTQSLIDALSFQIPANLRGMKLKHPLMSFKFDVPTRGEAADRDGKYTTILDILVKTGVLADDNIRNCNGVHEIMESETKDEHVTTIWITPQD